MPSGGVGKSCKLGLRGFPLSRSLRILGGMVLLMPVAGFLLACLGLEWPLGLVFGTPAALLEPILPESSLIETPLGAFLSPQGVVLVYVVPGVSLLIAGTLHPLYHATRPDPTDEG